MKMNQIRWTLFAGVMALSLANGAQATLPVADGPSLLARFDESDAEMRTLFLYSEEDLRSVYVWLHGRWAIAKRECEPCAEKKYYVYRVASRFAPADGSKLLVNSWIDEGQTTFRHELRVEASDENFRVRSELASTRSREEYLEDKRKAERASDPYGFIPLLNAYRARLGLRPVVHCPLLSQDARVNNSMGSPHAYLGRARVQNWAEGFSSAGGVLRGWQLSAGHNQNLLSPSISRVGIAYSHGEWTMNGS